MPDPKPHERSLLTQGALAALWLVACSPSMSASTDSRRSNGSSATKDSNAAAPESEVAIPVVAERVRRGDLILRVITTGQVRADAALKLRAEVSGTIARVLVRPGQGVTSGQPLVLLDPYPFDLAVREARAVADEVEQRFLESYIPESLVTGRGPTSAQRKSLLARSGLTGARLRLERAQFEQARATILSPMDGIIDAVDIAPGERIGGGQQLLTVVNVRNLRIEAQVLEHDLPFVRAGAAASLTSAGAPDRAIHGRIEAVLPLVDSMTRSGRAIVRVVGDGTLRPGMYADVQLEATRVPNRTLVPTRAVIERDGRPLVFVVKGGRAKWTYVTPGRSNGSDTEVLPDSATGLLPIGAGDSVIVEGHLTLTHEAPVRAVSGEAARGWAAPSRAAATRQR